MTVAVADGFVLLAWEQIEPVGEAEAEHDDPLVHRNHDQPLALALGAVDDALAHRLHPAEVAVAVGGLAVAHTVRAVDGVDLARLVATECLAPAHAVAATDGVG